MLIIHSVVALIDVFCNQFFLQIEKQISLVLICKKNIKSEYFNYRFYLHHLKSKVSSTHII